MAIGTAAAIAGSALTASGVLGGILSAPDNKSASDFQVKANDQLRNQFETMTDPSYGFGRFRKLANEAAGTMDQELQATAALGGSERLARARQAAETQDRVDQVMDQFSQFRLQTDQAANNLLGQLSQNQLRAQRMGQRQGLKRSEHFSSLANNVAGMGSTLLGQGFGSS